MARKISAHTTEAPGSTSDLIGNVGSTTRRFTAQQLLSIPITAQGDLLFGDSSANSTRLPIGTSGQVLQTSGGLPAWANSTSLRGATPWLNVKDYGAVGNGVADDTTAIQAAMDALPAAGGIVILPDGDYRITTGLTLGNAITPATRSTKYGIVLMGESGGTREHDYRPAGTAIHGARIVWGGDVGGTMISINGPVYGCGLQRLYIDAGTTKAGIGLLVQSGFRGIFKDLAFSDHSTAAIRVTARSTWTNVNNAHSMQNVFDNIEINVYDSSFAIGLDLGGNSTISADANNNFFRNLWILHSSVAGVGIRLQFADHNVFQDVNIYGGNSSGGTGILFMGDQRVGYPAQNYFYTVNPGVAGIDIDDAPSSIGTNIFIGYQTADGAALPTTSYSSFIKGFSQSGQFFGNWTVRDNSGFLTAAPTSGAVLTYSSASSAPTWSIPTSGAVLVASSVGTPIWRALGTSGQILQSTGGSPTWVDDPSTGHITTAGTSGQILQTSAGAATWVNSTTIPGALPSTVGTSGQYLESTGGVAAWITRPKVRADQETTVNMTNVTWTAVSPTTTRFDEGITTGMHTTALNTTRITIDSTGIWLIMGEVNMDPTSLGNSRLTRILENNSTVVGQSYGPAHQQNAVFQVSALWNVNTTGNYYTLQAWQDTGSTLDLALGWIGAFKL